MKKVTSWKTTLGGVISAVGAILPTLDPQLQKWATLLMAVGVAIIGMTARDNDVSSEEAGAKPVPTPTTPPVPVTVVPPATPPTL